MEDEVRQFCGGPDEAHFLKILRGLLHHLVIAELADLRLHTLQECKAAARRAKSKLMIIQGGTWEEKSAGLTLRQGGRQTKVTGAPNTGAPNGTPAQRTPKKQYTAPSATQPASSPTPMSGMAKPTTKPKPSRTPVDPNAPLACWQCNTPGVILRDCKPCQAAKAAKKALAVNTLHIWQYADEDSIKRRAATATLLQENVVVHGETKKALVDCGATTSLGGLDLWKTLRKSDHSMNFSKKAIYMADQKSTIVKMYDANIMVEIRGRLFDIPVTIIPEFKKHSAHTGDGPI